MPNGILVLAFVAAAQSGLSEQVIPSYPPAAPFGCEGHYEPRYPVNAQQNWVHGYVHEAPAYGGAAHFRPYNYQQVMSQSQISVGWGHSPVMPYSQQFWSKYHDRATMLKLSRSEPTRAIVPAAAIASDVAPSQTPLVIQPSQDSPAAR